MIGDTLFDCGESLDQYLADYEWPDEVRRRVQEVRERIREVQVWIDSGDAECLHNVKLQQPTVPPFIQWMQANGLGTAKHVSSYGWVVRSSDGESE
jgi:hypothetical protein